MRWKRCRNRNINDDISIAKRYQLSNSTTSSIIISIIVTINISTTIFGAGTGEFGEDENNFHIDHHHTHTHLHSPLSFDFPRIHSWPPVNMCTNKLNFRIGCDTLHSHATQKFALTKFQLPSFYMSHAPAHTIHCRQCDAKRIANLTSCSTSV